MVKGKLQAPAESSELKISILRQNKPPVTKKQLCSFYSNNLSGTRLGSEVRTVYLDSVLGKEWSGRLHSSSYTITGKAYPDHTQPYRLNE